MSGPDGLSLLTGDGVGDLLAAALAPSGGRPDGWSVQQIDHQPGLHTVVSYSTKVTWPSGAVTREILAAMSGPLPEGVVRMSDGTCEVGVWRFPHDPHLPALPDACDPDRLGELIGVRPTRVKLRAHRPGRRAVIEAETPRGLVFAKVLRPAQAAELHERHRAAVAAGCPAPAPLAFAPHGLVVLDGLPGSTLRSLLRTPDAVLPEPAELLALLETLPRELATRRRTTWGELAPHYAGVLAGTVPEVADRARAVAARVDVPPEGPEVVVHGDFYESQVMVDGGRVTGLLDIDTVGLGDRLDDLGCLLGHLSVLTQLWPARAAVVGDLGRRLHRRCVAEHDADALGLRAAAVVLSLATGPHRVQEPGWAESTVRRVELAERWLAGATDVWSG